VPEPAPEPTLQIAAEPPLESVAPAPEQKPARAVPKAKPKPARTQRPKVAAAQPREARAQPVAAQPAAAPAPPAPGGGSGSAASSASVAALEGDYLRGLQRAIARNRFYPPDARRRDVTGVVTVSFTVQSDGRLGDIRVAKGSGFEMLDQAALETLRRLGSYKPIPAATGKTRWPVRVPIVFDLR
jgi:protein TonB